MQPAIFLDKDGTLIPDIPYNVDPDLITLYPETGLALQRLKQAGFKLVVVSNQAGVARGYFRENQLPAVYDRMNQLLEPFSVTLDGFEYCPNHPQGTVEGYVIDCNRRKPKPGMLLDAAQTYDIDLPASWMIGDILNDVEAGNRAGCRTILVDRGNETEWQTGPYRTPTAIVNNLEEAVNTIVEYKSTTRLERHSTSKRLLSH
ncbi:D-glycero-alpha-D-manno-heptose-1,7-bisphosphate 7-phosphatase [Spirosoma soli]|uniref:D,D-heptose 1,7-bisphosphate phosphatase n=1 Tax=Spirosoma soli TaxID=1770529 RepID=A0ABW5M0J1_9BACT